MPQSTDNQRPNIREEAIQYYRDKKNIASKWLDQYGNLSRDNDYQRNRACMGEVFNMLDVVMDICIDDFRKSHTITSIDMLGRIPVYTFALEDGDRAKDSPDKVEVTFRMPTTFARRARTLRSIGYPISDELLDDTRLLRNETTHGNQTIVLRHMELGYDETRKALLSMADALICLEKLDPKLRVPSFDMLRVREGDLLMGGIYKVGPLAGEGGMSRVYTAAQVRTGKKLAVKELRPDTYSADTIRQECDTLSRIHHPAIPQIYDTFSENDTFYIVMDYIDGVPLDRYIELNAAKERPASSGPFSSASGGPLAPESSAALASGSGTPLPDYICKTILHGLCDVLSYLHSDEVGLVFADLSPSNILVDREGAPHLIDFGISGQKGQRQVLPAATPGYSAPEVFSERILDERTDIYSFGRILRLLYTGLSPLEKADVSAFDLIPDPVVAEAVERCTARSPLDRYASIEEVRAVLFPDEKNAPGDRAAAPKHRKLLVACGISAALGIAALAGYAGVLRDRNASLEEAAQPADSSLITMEEAGVEDHVIEWKDSGLEQGIRNALSLNGTEILLSDLWETTSLDISNYSIQNIEALSELSNLQYLTLDSNEISDLSPLSFLKQLQSLSVAGNQVEDLSPLASLEQLRSVDANYNRITDASPLRELKALEQLRLDSNPIIPADPAGSSTLDWIGDLPNLQSLHLCDLGINDCSFLENCPALTDLALSDNEISDLTPILRLDKLESLYLGHNKLSSLEGISRLSGLEQLELEGNPVGDLSPLAELNALYWLDAPDCGIRDLAPLKGLTMMASLALNDNPIEDLSPLSGLTRISYLDLSNTGIEGGVDELSGLTALKTLYLKNNRITDVSALAGLRSLQYLELSGNPIEDYSPLDDLKLLEKDF